MKDICELADNYVKLNYVLRRLNARINRLPEYLFSYVWNCDYRELGLSEEIIGRIENSNSSVQLLEVYNRIMATVDAIRVRLFDGMYCLSQEEKIGVKEYFDKKAEELNTKAQEYHNNYFGFVAQIEEAEKAFDNNKIRELGKKSKEVYSKYYELDCMHQTYDHLGSYLRGMIKHKTI